MQVHFVLYNVQCVLAFKNSLHNILPRYSNNCVVHRHITPTTYVTSVYRHPPPMCDILYGRPPTHSHCKVTYIHLRDHLILITQSPCYMVAEL